MFGIPIGPDISGEEQHGLADRAVGEEFVVTIPVQLAGDVVDPPFALVSPRAVALTAMDLLLDVAASLGTREAPQPSRDARLTA
jgi:hypothetical protein